MYFLFIALIVVIIVAFSAFVAFSVLHPPYSRPKANAPLSTDGVAVPNAWGNKFSDPRTDFGIDFADAEFPTVGGHTLRGWFIDRRGGQSRTSSASSSSASSGTAAAEGGGARARRSAGRSHSPSKDDICVVFVHGGGRDRRAFLRHTPIVCEKAGISALLYDARGHGASDLDHVGLSYGIREHEDAMSAVKHARSVLGFAKVVLFGTSVGAYSSILATARLPDEAVLGVIAENPFTNIEDNVRGIVLQLAFRRVLCRQNERLVWLSTPLRRVIDTIVWWIVARKLGDAAHVSTHNASAVIHQIKQPMLFMHGSADSVIEHHHTHVLFEKARAPKQLWIAPDADHCALLNAHPEEYTRRVIGFLEARVADHTTGCDPATTQQ